MRGGGVLARRDLGAFSDGFCRALEGIGTETRWLERFVTADKVYSVYIARDQRLIREHAYLSGFPADTICEVKAIIDPSTAREARRAKETDVAKESGMY